jgi:hypothetical protein
MTEVWRTFRALPAAEQTARVVALRAGVRDCRPDVLTVLDTP